MKYLLIIVLSLLISCSGDSKEGNDGSEKKEDMAAIIQKEREDAANQARMQAEAEFETQKRLEEEYRRKKEESPSNNLQISFKWTDPLFGGDFIEGNIYNKSNDITYKDIILNVIYRTKTNTVIKQWNTVLYEFISPGKNQSFRIELGEPPSHLAKIAVIVNNAKIER